jgi:hypothetical protein
MHSKQLNRQVGARSTHRASLGMVPAQHVSSPAVPAMEGAMTRSAVAGRQLRPATAKLSTRLSRKVSCKVSNVVADAKAPSIEQFQRGKHWHVHKFGGTCMANADRIKAVSQLMIDEPGDSKVVVVSAMGSSPTSPIKVTDLILNMIKKAANQDAAFLVDLAALQEKHVVAAKELLGESPELTDFIARLLDDISNLKAMLQAICIGEQTLGCTYTLTVS